MHGEVTLILEAIDRGDAGASQRLLPLVYEELRALADRRLAHERPGQTLQATALVHEAYLRLVGPEEATEPVQWDSRGHFFAAAAEAMRRILLDRARAKAAIKRGGAGGSAGIDGGAAAAQRIKLDPSQLTLDAVPAELIDLDEALTKFAAEEPAKADLVKLRFFGGLSLKQAATILGISPTTADRHWAYARAWLYDELSPDR